MTQRSMPATPPTISGVIVHAELGDHDMPRHTMTQELGELLSRRHCRPKKRGSTINIKNLDKRAKNETHSQQSLTDCTVFM